MKDKIRPFYSELQGYLREAPPAADTYSYDTIIIENLNKLIDQISLISEKDYARFKVRIVPESPANEYDSMGSSASFQIQEYRSNLAGLIANLHGHFFSKEPPPFSGMPNTIINANQTQSQSVDITLLLAMQSRIEEQLTKFPEGSKERTFLQKLKGALPIIKDATQLISQLFTLAKTAGLSVDDLFKIFS